MRLRKTGWTGVVATMALLALAGSARAQDHDHRVSVADADLRGLHFATTCRPTVGGLIDLGVGYLHAFAFDEAAAMFRQAAHSDIDCTTAYWGSAMAHWGRFARSGGADALAEGWRALDTAELLRRAPSPREKRYIDALRRRYRERLGDGPRQYVAALGELARDFPEDRHAALFAALALVEQPAGSADEAARLGRAALAILDGLPAHDLAVMHYATLAGDRPGVADAAVAQAHALAALDGQSSYLQLVPGRVFVRLGHWDAAVTAGRRAADTARAAGAPGDELRALALLVYAELQVGRGDEARAIVRRLDGGYLADAADADAPAIRAAIAAGVALETDDLPAAAALPAPDAAGAAVMPALLARAIAAARLSRAADSATAAARLSMLAAETQDSEAISAAATAWAAFAAGRTGEAVAQLRAAAAVQESAAGAPALPASILPVREQLGDLLRALGRPDEAAAAYAETLRRWPGRARARTGLAAASAAPG
jgi:hypothetical protein